jgi:hypothetical protein
MKLNAIQTEAIRDYTDALRRLGFADTAELFAEPVDALTCLVGTETKFDTRSALLVERHELWCTQELLRIAARRTEPLDSFPLMRAQIWIEGVFGMPGWAHVSAPRSTDEQRLVWMREELSVANDPRA